LYRNKGNKRSFDANGGQIVGQVMIVNFIIKNQTVSSSQNALKEINVNSITNKRHVCMDQIAIQHSVDLTIFHYEYKRGFLFFV
jgi:hypothetical protein